MPFRKKVPFFNSSKALCNSSSVFITIGPPQATGSPRLRELKNNTCEFLSVDLISTWLPDVSFAAVFSLTGYPPIYASPERVKIMTEQSFDMFGD